MSCAAGSKRSPLTTSLPNRHIQAPGRFSHMKLKNIPLLALTLLIFSLDSPAQKTSLTVSFNEQFFDALLDAVFQYAPPPEISLAKATVTNGTPHIPGSSFTETVQCSESIKLLRENGGVRTAVRFKDGEIHAPIAFSGNYSPPFIGCVPFAGLADAIIDLEFDQAGQRLIARARVQDVSLNGTGGLAGGLVARMVQGSIDKRINPIEIIRTDKVSFLLPMKGSSIKMKAIGFSHAIAGGQLNIRVLYEFERGN